LSSFYSNRRNSGKLVLRNQNIRNGRLNLNEKSYTDLKNYEDRIKRLRPQGGDLVITREAPMGEVCILPDGLDCCLGQRMVLLRINPKIVSGKYLLFAIQSKYVQDEIQLNEGTGMVFQIDDKGFEFIAIVCMIFNHRGITGYICMTA
jgi:type I restriction enzyme S subunit